MPARAAKVEASTTKPPVPALPVTRAPSAPAKPEIKIGEEAFGAIVGELPLLVSRFGQEIAPEGLTADPDWKQMLNMAATGMLRVVTVRADGCLVGFVISIVGPHMLYRTVLHAMTNACWLDPVYREGWVGVKLFKENLRLMKSLGCQRTYIATRNPRLGQLFERLGYSKDEVGYTKVL